MIVWIDRLLVGSSEAMRISAHKVQTFSFFWGVSPSMAHCNTQGGPHRTTTKHGAR